MGLDAVGQKNNVPNFSDPVVQKRVEDDEKFLVNNILGLSENAPENQIHIAMQKFLGSDDTGATLKQKVLMINTRINYSTLKTCESYKKDNPQETQAAAEICNDAIQESNQFLDQQKNTH